MLGEDEELFSDLLLELEPEDGVIWVCDVDDRGSARRLPTSASRT